MRSMIWSAVLVHLKGRAVAFQPLIQSSSAMVSSSREQNTPRSRQRRCSSANHRSTWLIHDGVAVLLPAQKQRLEFRAWSGCGGAVAFEDPVHGGSGDGEQLGEVGLGVLAGVVHPYQLALLPGGVLRLLAAQLALRAGDGIPSRVRSRSRSTSNSAKVARMLKNILPGGSVGS